jgi:MinD-like ATPase involved in chromosome partitioning or flagellar assembly
MMNRKAAVIDFNLTTSHLGLSLGCFAGEKTLNNFLRKEAKLEEIVLTHETGLKFIPASLELGELPGIDTESLEESIKKSLGIFDYIFLDSAPGLGKEALLAFRACDEAIFVANPCIASVVDILKARNLSEFLDFRNTGIIMNRVRKKNYELRQDDIMHFTELPVLAEIPEDESVLRCSNALKLPVAECPKSRASRAIFGLAYQITNQWRYPFSYYGRVS